MSIEFSPCSSVNRQRTAGVLSRATRASGLALAGAAALALANQPLQAQAAGKGFLFNSPVGSFTLRGGYALANAASDVFSDATTQLTLDKRDFSSISYGGDIAYSVKPRIDLIVDASVSATHKDSEFRHFIDNNDEPIEQSTKYRRVPLTFGMRYYLTDRGRSVGQFAYIPSKYAPYVGVGAGAMYYHFEQEGDFVDFKDFGVFPAKLVSTGWTPMAHGSAGLDYSVGPWLALTGEARYQWARAQLDQDVFVGYDKIDLSGVTGTVGFKVRF
ncbi:MAG TPA: hypothetical protein VM076_03220 [Gemmatimonadaceae bacterium]|nr:hypothetical protein [Gemmatimonadaceae bacterium]